MRTHRLLIAPVLATSVFLSAEKCLGVVNFGSNVDNDWFRAWPPSGVTFFAGATFSGGTYVVADDFGSRRGRSDLDAQPVDFQEVRVGGGLRYTFNDRLGIELGGGWTVDRRYHFRERHLLLNGDGAPYVQLSFGLMF